MSNTNSNEQKKNTPSHQKNGTGFGISFVNTTEDFKKKVIKCINLYEQLEDLRSRYLEGNRKINLLIENEVYNSRKRRKEYTKASEDRIQELDGRLKNRQRIYQKNQGNLQQYYDYLIKDIFNIEKNDHILYTLYKDQVYTQSWEDLNSKLVEKTINFFEMNNCLKRDFLPVDLKSEQVVGFVRRLYSEGVGFNSSITKTIIMDKEIKIEKLNPYKKNKFYYKFLRLLYVKFVAQKDTKPISKDNKNNEEDLNPIVVVNKDLSSSLYVPQVLCIRDQRMEPCWEHEVELRHKDKKKKDNIYNTDKTESNPEKYSSEYYKEEMKKRKKEEKRLRKALKKQQEEELKEKLRNKYLNEKYQKSEKEIIEERANRYKEQNTHQINNKIDKEYVNMNVHEIKPKDFLTRSNLSRCTNTNHKLIDIIGEIKILNSKGEVELVSFPAAYCSTCNKYYILESEYRKLKWKGRIICKVVEHSFWNQTGNNSIYNFNQESLLHILGYNVNAQENLPARQRQRILEIIINEKILTKAEVCSHLDYLINRSKGRANMANACEKWKMDREYISRHNRKVETVKVRSIDHNNYFKN